MSITETEPDFWTVDFGHGCLTNRVSRMWRRCQPPLPRYGPHKVRRVLSDDELKVAVAFLAESVRALCIYNIKHDDEYDELQSLQKHFYFKNSKTICNYLMEHASLVPLLFQVRKKVDEYFGTETLTNLELFTDPEDSNSTPKLFVLILTPLPFEGASTRLDQFDEEWWFDQPDEVRRLSNIDVEYVDASV